MLNIDHASNFAENISNYLVARLQVCLLSQLLDAVDHFSGDSLVQHRLKHETK